MAVSQGTLNKQFVSAIDFLDQREIDPSIYDQSNDKNFTNIMKVVNAFKPTTMPSYHNFVNNDVYETGTISAVTTTGTSKPVFTINTAAAFPRPGDLIQSSNTLNAGKQAWITAVTLASGTATITAQSVAGNSSTFWVTVGDIVSFGSNAFAQKSTAPRNRRYGLTKYYNLVQIFREVDEITDIQKVSKIEVNVDGQYYILPYQIIQKKIKLEGDISYQMIAGVQSATQFGDANAWLTDPTSGETVQTTGGLNWYITTYGLNDTAAVLGTFGFTELDKICDNFISNKAPKKMMAFMGSRVAGVISKFLKNLASSGVTSVRLNIDGNALDFNVDQLSYRNFTFKFIPLDILDHPQLFSSTISADINGSLFMVPEGMIDTVDNGQQKRMQIRHQPSPFGKGVNGTNNGIMAEWRTGALADVPTNDDALLRTNFYAEQGLECLGVKFFQKYRVI